MDWNVSLPIVETQKNEKTKKTGKIYGQITDSDSGEPISYATVRVSGGYGTDNNYSFTDKDGLYSAAIPESQYFYIYIDKHGYYGTDRFVYNRSPINRYDMVMQKMSINYTKDHIDHMPAEFENSYSNLWMNNRHYNPRFNIYFLRRIFRVHRSYRYKKMRAIACPTFGGNDKDVSYDMTDYNGFVDGVTIGKRQGSLSLAEVEVSKVGGVFRGSISNKEEVNYDENTTQIPGINKSATDTTNYSVIPASTNIFQHVRSNFSDYAYWKNYLFTDEKGHASFNVKFPDNITQWVSYVLAMDGSKHSGSGFIKTKAYNIINASLSMPRFMLYGDTANVVGKSINLGNDSISIQTTFKQNDLALRGCRPRNGRR